MIAAKIQRKGMILVVVLIVVFMLSLAGLSFVVLMSTENKAVHLRGKELQAQCLLGSGEAAVMAYIQQSRGSKTSGNNAASAAYIKTSRELFCSVMVTGDERIGRGGRFSVLSPRIEDGQAAGFRFGIENESARLNLGVLPDWERRRPGSARDAIMSLPGMSEPIADAILDWIDADDRPRRFGAESEYYRGINVPYLPRGATPGCLEELLLIKGVSRNLLLGADVNCNYTIEPQEKRLADAGNDGRRASLSALPLASLLTVYSGERNRKPNGSPRVDLNQKDLQKLSKELDEVFEPSWARFIILYRQFGPRDNDKGNETTDSGPQEPREEPKIDFNRPPKFSLKTLLHLVDAEIEIPAGDDGKTSNGDEKKPTRLKSPIANDPASLEQALDKLLDNATVFPGAVIRGRVNIDLAPRPVVEGIPGLEDAAATRILAARGTASGSVAAGGAHRHATWLLHRGLVDLEQMKAIMPFVTAGGDVYRAQIVGFFDRPAQTTASGPVARAELVVDATGERPQRVYWKDLRILGPGFSPSILGGVQDGEDE